MVWREEFDWGSLDPEAIEMLCEATEEALIEIEKRGRILDRDACRLAIARKMIERAKDGERSRQVLVSHAVAAFRPSGANS